ncbi:MAG: hypothetical protein ACXVB1_18390 [Pseudobdellovibrionaceae bacterium]
MSKLKPFVGLVTRGSNLNSQLELIHSEGKMVPSLSFTSASKGKPFVGDFKFFIESKNGRYIAPLSIHPDEEEVLFFSPTNFLVTKKIGKDIYLQEK